jgi:hypothetical protein
MEGVMTGGDNRRENPQGTRKAVPPQSERACESNGCDGKNRVQVGDDMVMSWRQDKLNQIDNFVRSLG